MKVFEHYHLPATVDEALSLLAQYQGRARVIAGGTDLLVDSQAQVHKGQRPYFDALIDVTRIAGADDIHARDGYIEIGCAVTHTRIVASRLVRAQGAALAEACAVVGGPQVRNVATLCGNVAHALPAADGTVALMALDAEAQVARLEPAAEGPHLHTRWYPLVELFKGPAVSAVDPTCELITAIRFRALPTGEASAFARVMRPQGVALPILGMATRIALRNSTLEHVAISAGPVAPVPFRAHETEEFLRGKTPDKSIVAEASRILLREANPRTSPHRATREYRLELLPVLLEQTLRKALERAGGTAVEPVG